VAPKYTGNVTDNGWTARTSNSDPADDYKLTIQQDASAPMSPSNVIRGEFTQGNVGGSAPFSLERPFGAGELFPKLYMCIWVKHSAGFDNTNGNAGSKFMWTPGNTLGGGETYMSHDGPNMNFQIIQQGRVDRQMGQNVGPAGQATMLGKRGQWVQYEIVIEMNSSQGTANGKFDMWIDGVKTHQYTNVDYSISSARNWYALRWEPTYGGGNNPVPQTQYQYIDHIRISGSP
jgi:hypothetical protein